MTVANGIPGERAPKEIDRRKHEFARALERKLQKGYEIETQNGTQALLVTKARRRLFGLLRSSAARHITSMDEQGNVTTRQVDASKRLSRAGA